MNAPIALRWQTEDVPSGEVRLHVRRVVMPTAPPILLLHGLGVTGSVWVPFARRLAPRYAAIAPDLRGHGASDEPPTGYAPADYARDLAHLCDALAITALPVLGHSLGALVALALADQRRDLVTALALVDPPLDPAIPYEDVQQVYRLRHEPVGALEAYLLAADPGGNVPLAEALARMFRQAADAAFEAVLATRPDEWDAWEQASHLAQPTLVVRADPAHGGILGATAAQALVARLRHGRLLFVPHAAHAVHATHPAELASAVLAFLDEAAPPPWH
jgi:pimeloyl-ACP methyl ester carboxylesterase